MQMIQPKENKEFTATDLAIQQQTIREDLARKIIDQLNQHCMCMDCAVKAVEVIRDI